MGRSGSLQHCKLTQATRNLSRHRQTKAGRPALTGGILSSILRLTAWVVNNFKPPLLWPQPNLSGGRKLRVFFPPQAVLSQCVELICKVGLVSDFWLVFSGLMMLLNHSLNSCSLVNVLIHIKTLLWMKVKCDICSVEAPNLN